MATLPPSYFNADRHSCSRPSYFRSGVFAEVSEEFRSVKAVQLVAGDAGDC